METTIASQARSKSWLPERGWPLFGAWLGGLIIVALMYVVLTHCPCPFPKTGVVVWTIPSLIGYAWQAWLLFRQHPVRFLLWTAIPLPYAVAPAQFQILSLLTLFFQAVLLWLVRERPWAWIVAGMMGLALSAYLSRFTSASGNAPLLDILGRLNFFIGQPVGQYLYAGIILGIGSLTGTVCGAVLAWKMPPLNLRKSSGDRR